MIHRGGTHHQGAAAGQGCRPIDHPPPHLAIAGEGLDCEVGAGFGRGGRVAGLNAEPRAVTGGDQQGSGRVGQDGRREGGMEPLIGFDCAAQITGNGSHGGIGPRDWHRQDDGLQIRMETVEIQAHRKGDRVTLGHGASHRQLLLPGEAIAGLPFPGEGAAAIGGGPDDRGHQRKVHTRVEGRGDQLGLAVAGVHAEVQEGISPRAEAFLLIEVVGQLVQQGKVADAAAWQVQAHGGGGGTPAVHHQLEPLAGPQVGIAIEVQLQALLLQLAAGRAQGFGRGERLPLAEHGALQQEAGAGGA